MSEYDDGIEEFNPELFDLARRVRLLIEDAVPGTALTEEDVQAEFYEYNDGHKTVNLYFSMNCPPGSHAALCTLFVEAGMDPAATNIKDLFNYNEEDEDVFVELDDEPDLIARVVDIIEQSGELFSQLLNNAVFQDVEVFDSDQMIVYLYSSDKNMDAAVESIRAMIDTEGAHFSITKENGVTDVSITGKGVSLLFEGVEETIFALTTAIGIADNDAQEKPGTIASNASVAELGKVAEKDPKGYEKAKQYLISRHNGGGASLG